MEGTMCLHNLFITDYQNSLLGVNIYFLFRSPLVFPLFPPLFTAGISAKGIVCFFHKVLRLWYLDVCCHKFLIIGGPISVKFIFI